MEKRSNIVNNRNATRLYRNLDARWKSPPPDVTFGISAEDRRLQLQEHYIIIIVIPSYHSTKLGNIFPPNKAP